MVFEQGQLRGVSQQGQHTIPQQVDRGFMASDEQ
jgi:hypothetical protein